MKLSNREVAEMPPIDYQAQVVAWSKGRDKPSAEDIAQAEKMVARWNLIRKQRNQLEIL